MHAFLLAVLAAHNEQLRVKELCELLRIPATPSVNDEEFLFQHVQFKTGQRVHTIGQPFDTLFIVHSGFLKTVLIDEFGNEQVLSFPMKGDLFGVDGIHTKRYASEAVALSKVATPESTA